MKKDDIILKDRFTVQTNPQPPKHGIPQLTPPQGFYTHPSQLPSQGFDALQNQLPTQGIPQTYGQAKKTVTLNNKFTIQVRPYGRLEVIVDAEAALKAIGMAYGLYSRAEDDRDQRVVLDDDHIPPVLLVQEDVARHGSPMWETKHILAEDKDQIAAYMKFREILRYISSK